MKTHRILLSALCLLAFVFSARAEAYTIETVPSPKVWGQDYYVSNPDTVLTFQTVQELNALCARLDTNTGVELAVVAIDEYDENRYYDSYDFALELFNSWGIGDKDRNTGVLVFLVRGYRDIQIITGDGVAGMLTDAKCGELLDDNLYYFADGRFNAGMLALCADIEDFLMLDDNRAELLLGWAPADTVVSDVFLGWIFIGLIVMILLAFKGYNRLHGKPGQPEENVLKCSDDARTEMGCLSVFFPIPMLFLYLFYRFFRKHPEVKPMVCKKCGAVMEAIPANLNNIQSKEQELKVYAFTHWHCPECGAELSGKFDGRNIYKYTKCKACGGRTDLLTGKKTTRRATLLHEGTRVDTYTCQCCGAVQDYKVKLDRKRLLPSGGGSGSGGGGSWGGGRSSGGGAGRSF